MRLTKHSAAFLLLSLLLIACGGGEVTVGDGGNTDGEVIGEQKVTPLPQGANLKDPNHGKPVSFLYGAVLGVNKVNANGVGFLYKFEDGTFMGTLTLNVEKAAEGSAYYAWLTSADGKEPLVSVGEVVSILGDVRHALRYEFPVDISAYNKVVISEEKKGSTTQIPSRIVAEGVLKAPQTAQ